MKHYSFVILFLSFAISLSAQVKDYPHAQDAIVSDTYSLNVSGTNILVEKFKNFDYAHIELSKAAEAAVKINVPIEQFTISPLSKKIQAKITGNELSFEFPDAGYYVVSINNGRKLFILADSPEKKAVKYNDRNTLSVMDFVTDNEGKILQTAQLQKALNMASGSGKTLYFPAGIYKTGMLSIHSNTNIYLAAGAMIKGSDDRKDYPSDDNKPESDHINNPENYTDYGEWMTFSRLIFIDKAENVKISGRGIIDGNGKTVRDQGKPANLIRIRNSKNVTIEGVILRDPAAWNTHILYSSNVTIRDVKILNDFDVPNTDGIDPDASKNVLVDNCFAYCNDDNIAIKTTNNGNYLQDADNIKVKNCVFYTRKSALKIGTETKGKYMQNIVFENNDVLVSDRGIVFYCFDGATFRNIKYINNRFEKPFEKGQQRGIHISLKNRYGAGKIENIQIKNNTFYTPFPKSSEIFGLDNEHKVSNLEIENLVIKGKQIKSLEEADIVINEFVENINIKPYEYFRKPESEGAAHIAALRASYTNLEQWEARKALVRENIFREAGLSPLPQKTPLNPKITNKRVYNGYTVENVSLEVLPGVYLCGSLYKPAKKGKYPAMLCPHGHFYNKIDRSIPNERGRYRPDQQYRCAMLARLGVVVFSYDMFAWGESALQVPLKEHRTGLALTMQTWNSMRIIDFLTSLDYIDKTRIGITGASGGGTQSFLASALDDRITLSVPTVMVSCHFYGGCPCESGLPIHHIADGLNTNNAEIAALCAPRPQLLISDGNDWTSNTPEVEYPYLQYVYNFYGKENLVENAHFAEEGHDYGPSKRFAMYDFVARQFNLDVSKIKDKNGDFDESKVSIEPAENMYAFGREQKLPENAVLGAEEVKKVLISLQK